jgi:CRP-like cAMP-binding protein
MSETPRPNTENRILSALPREDYDRLSSQLEPVNLLHSQNIYHAEGRIEHVFFLSNSMVSLVSQQSDGTAIEVGVTGFEGMVGLPIVLGIDRSPHECMVQIPDGTVRVRADVIRQEFRRAGALHDLLLRYAHSLMVTLGQVATCNRAHSACVE